MNKKEKEYYVYAIVYKRIRYSDKYYIFIPCDTVYGLYNEETKVLIDKKGKHLVNCNSYDIVKSANKYTFGYDLVVKDLIEVFKTDDIDLALKRFYDYYSNNILIGKVDDTTKSIILNNISIDFMDDLVKDYKIENNEGNYEVTLTKAQIISLLRTSNFKLAKQELHKLLSAINFTEKLSEFKPVKKVTGTIGTTNLLVHEAEKAVSPNIITPEKEKVYLELFSDDTKDTEKTRMCKKLYEYITKYLVGQDDAVKKLLSVVMTNLKATSGKEIIRPLVIGQTGSGKSYFFKLLEKILDIPVYMVDCNTLVQAGYVGKSIDDVLKDLYMICNKDIDKTEHALIIFDEFDKLANNGADVSELGVQKALLKFFEGHKYVVALDKNELNKAVIDTSMMNIVACGAFETLVNSRESNIGFGVNSSSNITKKITVDSLINYGMISEIIGRFGIIVEYNKVTLEMLKKQLLHSLDSPLEININKFKRDYDINLSFSEEFVDTIARAALENKTGFRGTEQMVNESLLDTLFEIEYGTFKDKTLKIDKSFIKNHDSKVKKLGTN